MLKKTFFVLVALILAIGLVGVGLYNVAGQANGIDGSCPAGYALVVLLDPILPGEQSSKVTAVGCQPFDEANVEEVMLEPIRPGEEGWSVEPEVVDEGEAVNGLVRGPSIETDYRCVVLLEPIQPGEQFSKASEPICSDGPIDSVNGVSLASSFLITRFYNKTNYSTLLVEYFGAYACSETINYGVADLPDNLDNKFASGRAYSACKHIHVYDFNNYSGPSYSCGENCSSFYALNDEVSSWSTNY